MRVTETKMVKSAGRVLEVLEFFNAHRQHVSVMDVARALNYPQSSTSELLRCLTSLGYLSYDAHRRAYRPTARVAILGAWVEPELFRRGHLLSMIDELSARTGELIVLATTVGLAVRYIHAIEAAGTRPLLPQAMQQPLLCSTVGRLFLSTYEERKLASVVHRLNAVQTDPARRVRLCELAEDLARIRQDGYARSAACDAAGRSLIAMLLPNTDADQPLAVGLGTDGAGEAASERLIETLREAIARYCPTAAPVTRPPAEWRHEALTAA